MPNHVEHDLLITGKPETLAAFLAGCKLVCDDGTECLDICGGHYPMPGSVKNMPSSTLVEGAWAAKYGDENTVQYWLAMPWAAEKGIVDRPTLLAHFIAQDASAEQHADQRQSNIATHQAPDWYEWAIQHYGSKWGDYETTGEIVEEQYLDMHFRSAWSPLTKALLHISTKWPTLRFDLSYFECGMAFQGKQLIENGAILSEWTGEYHGRRGG